MAKAIVVATSAQMVGVNAVISYSVVFLGPPNSDMASEYVINTGISVANNITAWRNKIIAEGLEKTLTLLSSDVIIFGSPV